ncbi:N-acetyl sugar amidotransferase [Candidatus Marinamargulisbacteria bacterium SCGC AG-333-B06]|nr:N-acetyl sugar amidotransferase [Candidatus Marinamargulisbacteria bacterium SCGC AG-333-B06]
MTFKQCSVCVMDTTDPDINFDDKGICNHYYRYKEQLASRIHLNNTQKKLQTIIEKIKSSNKHGDYDCVIGISGGVDSTYIAYLVKQYSLNPLAVHFDNGWNSELAVQNIEHTLKILDIDLYTYVMDWETFKEIQKAFLCASTPDGEIPTDHAINSVLYQVAVKFGIKYIINGMNFKTESIAVSRWAYGHSDWRYIKGICKHFNVKSLKGYPHFSLFNLMYYLIFKKIKVISILNYIDYNKNEAMHILKSKLNWQYYGGKHYESIYTRFYQSYILPKKFNIDKRKIHYSDLIFSKQMTKDEALKLLKKPTCDPDLQEEDKEFVLKKLSLTQKQFDDIMNLQIKSYSDYQNNASFVFALKKIYNRLRKIGFVSK